MNLPEEPQINEWRALIHKCTIHNEHCAVCGQGLNVVEGELLGGDAVYSDYGAGDEEVDHIRCHACLDMDKLTLPVACSQWDGNAAVQALLHTLRMTRKQQPCYAKNDSFFRSKKPFCK